MQSQVIVGAAAVTSGALCLWWSVSGDRRLKATVAKKAPVKRAPAKKKPSGPEV